ncbi:ribosome maturation factor RimM [Candidatus Nitrosacidococcus tergens]|uniref:Ribosome maturation factor RimM n=1 Tax=Candidatus Nitrosacidococcus tergens TaxID=553981 RepID=A0A7G1Q8Q2_9GAMM|nr:ribosome maturation factor RimM [Candidatus Nitrosacidococcus tergens]CAB1275163.1 16S rRNA processing protein [Candidatus Nitrosacidococcus tergens]
MKDDFCLYTLVGKILGLYGVRGWVKVYSYTDPPSNILSYNPWYLKKNNDWQTFTLVDGHIHGKKVAACLEGITDRDFAAQWINCSIEVKHDQLAPLEYGKYYWTDLIGLEVVTLTGYILGQVVQLLETGANDVLIVKGERERYIPFLLESTIKQVDLTKKVIIVEWDLDF